MKVENIVKLLVLILLSSCSSSRNYFLVINHSAEPVEVKYKVETAEKPLFYAKPKVVRFDDALETEVGNIKENGFERAVSGEVNLPPEMALILGSFKKGKLSGDPLSWKVKQEQFNLKMIKIQSKEGSVAKEGEEVKKIFHQDEQGNWRVVIRQ